VTRIFISYSRRDKHITQQLAELLRFGYEVWYDTEIPGGVEWWQHIVQQIVDCDCFIFLLSPESVTSKYCLDEYQEAQKPNKLILPVLVRDNTQLPDVLKHIQAICLFDDKNLISAEGISRVYGAIERYISHGKRGTQPTFDIVVARRQADLRLLNSIWKYLSVHAKLFLESEFSAWNINYDNYKSQLIEYIEIIGKAEFAFNNNNLELAFEIFNSELWDFAQWLEQNYEITGKDGKAVMRPKVRRVKEYSIYQHNAEIFIEALKDLREKLIRTIRHEYPEFDFKMAD
jgi:hypothetical protein